MTRSLRDALRERVLLLDGGVGSGLLAQELHAQRDFGGLPGCCEVLNLRRPDVVRELHEAFLAAGCDAITTNSFCGDPPTLSARGLGERTGELNLAAARIARAAAERHARDGRARFVLGSLGPGLRAPSRGPEGAGELVAELVEGYRAQARALLEGGVDALLVETCRGARQARAAVEGATRARAEAGSAALLMLSFAPEADGTLADGRTLLEALEPLEVDLVGINCVQGPTGLAVPLARLARFARAPLGAWPNAGLPVDVAGLPRWPLDPDTFADGLAARAQEHDLRLVGGCCGTTPAHIAALAARLRPI